MELNITKFFKEAAPMDYSASRAEIGENAAKVTWTAAMDGVEDYPLLDDEEKRQAFRDYIKGFGAWDADEIAAMSDDALGALLIQLISGDIREAGLDGDSPDWDAYEADENKMNNLFRGDDGEVYYYVGE